MRHQVEIKVNIYLPSENYENDKELIQNRIDYLTLNIAEYQTRLKMFASANPKDITPDEWKEESIRWIDIQVTEVLEYISEFTIELANLETYLEQLEYPD